MGNEELALMIQAGHTEHYGELWERCRKLLFAILRQKTRGLRVEPCRRTTKRSRIVLTLT